MDWQDFPGFNLYPHLDYVECFCSLAGEPYCVNANDCCEACDSVTWGE